MPLREDILNPIPGDFPAGKNLRYDPVYDKLKELRREDDDAPQGEWQRERKTADYPKVILLTSEAIATKSKDLQLVVWLVEALLKKEGITALRQGIELTQHILEQFWDGCFPEIEDDDLELRAAPIDWMGAYLDRPVRMLPINKQGHNWFQYKESRAVGYNPEGEYDENKTQRYQAAIADGKITGEEFDIGLRKTNKSFYKAHIVEVDATLESLENLNTLCQDKFRDVAPSFMKLRTALEEVRHTSNMLLQEKLKEDPDEPVDDAPVEEAPVEASTEEYAASEESAAPVVRKTVRKRSVTGLDPADREDAVDRLCAVAAWMRKEDPNDPAPYLILRGLRWGELRAAGGSPDPVTFEPPQTEVRQQIKRLSMEGNYQEMLEVAETAMGTTAGRAWLDLQRYTVTACDNLGYSNIASAVKSELKALLADLPDLPSATLMDDTPTANGETQAWLTGNVLPPKVEESQPVQYYEPPPMEQYHAEETGANGDAPQETIDAFQLAREAAMSGDKTKAVEILTREFAQERCGRGRFQRRMQLAQICLSIGHEAIAKPILEELAGEIERRRLEEWETGDIVAHPLALLYRCLEKDQEDRRQKLYAWICRLDPVQALACMK